MATQPNWSDWFINLPSNDAGNQNFQAFSDSLSSGETEAAKLLQVTEEIDTVILAANASREVMMLHSPRNFGGTRTRPANKLICMLGMGPQAVCVLVDLNSALANCDIIVPTANELLACTTVQEVEAIAPPARALRNANDFEGSAVFIPGPLFRNAIIASGTTNPLQLIPLITATARAFEVRVNDEGIVCNGDPVSHASNIHSWLFGVSQGTIGETRYSVLPDDVEVMRFNNERHLACISRGGIQGGAAAQGGALANDDAFQALVRQLTHGISAQTEVIAESNQIQERFFERQDNREEAKMDRTKKIYPGILKMIGRAAAAKGDDSLDIPASCLRFFNHENVGMAQYDLVHQFKEMRAQDVTFATGTTNALYIGQFLWSDPSTPSNFTMFAFREQEPNTDSRQEDFMVCHLIREEGQKKSVDEIKASLKQTVHIPSDVNGLGIQIQLFEKASRIFFGDDSVLTENLNQLHLEIARNKTSFKSEIAVDEFFVAKFMFAVDRRVQRWLKSCEKAVNSRNEVNDSILDFDDVIEHVLNGTFSITLPPAFSKVKADTSEIKDADGKHKGGEGGEEGKGRKKRKSEDGKGNAVKNSTQPDEFKLTSGENWKEQFAGILTTDRPAWNEKVRMCARWHIKGDCYDNCSRKDSHVPNDKIPDDKRAAMTEFIAKCRAEIGKKKSA